MTTGYICDRCGETFASGGKWLYGGYSGSDAVVQHWDLCPECMEGFAEWMANDEKELRFANYGHDYGQMADMSEKSADCVRDGGGMSEIHEGAREHSLESESVRERPESVREQHYESQDVTGDAERVTESPEMSHDTRKKLEADATDFCERFYTTERRYDELVKLLDRQEAITEREFFETACDGCERLGGDGGPTLDELCDELRKYIVKTDRLGAALDDRDAQLADVRDALDAAWSERDQWRDAYRDSERLRLELVKDLEHARRWSDKWRDLVHRYEGLCDGLLDERDAMRGEAS